MPEKTPLMSTKRGKLTAGKARERVASLEESISARQHRLDQLEARLERTDAPDERLLTAKTRLERRLVLEREQLEKLQKLLQRDTSQPEESGEYFASEEIDDLHRSFEEVRQNLAQMQARIESTELPRDLGSRLSSFEERVTRREEVDSELFSQVLSLQTALDQERQAVRRLSRRTREQDQSLDALREAVEDSVVATVDLAERLEELEEAMSESSEAKGAGSPHTTPIALSGEMEMLRELAEDARRGLLGLQKQVAESLATAAQEREALRVAQAEFAEKQSRAESLAEDLEDSVVRRLEDAVGSQLEAAVNVQVDLALANRVEQLDLAAAGSANATALSQEVSAQIEGALAGLQETLDRRLEQALEAYSRSSSEAASEAAEKNLGPDLDLLAEQVEGAIATRLEELISKRLEVLLDERLESLVASRLQSVLATSPSPAGEPESGEPRSGELQSLLSRLEVLERARPGKPEEVSAQELSVGTAKPAVFAKNGSHRRQVALFGVRPPAGPALMTAADTKLTSSIPAREGQA